MSEMQEIKDLLVELIDRVESVEKGAVPKVDRVLEKALQNLDRKFKKKDYDKLKRIKILFISNPGEHKDLVEKRMFVCDEKYLNELEGCVYITADDFETSKSEAEELKNNMTKVDEKKLASIIESYRSERT